MSETERGYRGNGHGGRPMSADELEQELEHTRQQMRGTLDAIIRQKLSPDALMHRAREAFGGPEEFARNLSGAVRRNPVPATVAAIGLGWLMWSDRHPAAPPTRHSAGEMGHSAADTAKGMASEWRERSEAGIAGARERTQEAVAQGRARSEEWADSARLMAIRARRAGTDASDFGRRLFEEQPFLVGAVGLALGALVGAALPRSRVEDETIGPMRDKTLSQAGEKAKSTAGEVAGEVERRVQETGEAAKEAIARKGKKRGRQPPQQRPH